MSTIQLDKDNNIKIINNNINLIEGINELSQTLINKISLCKGENSFNIEEGVDYNNEFLNKIGGMDYIKNSIKNIILEEDGVLSIEDTNIFVNDNKLTIVNKIKTDYGNIVI